MLLGFCGLAVLGLLWWFGTDVLAAPASFVRRFSPTSAFVSLAELLASSDLPVHVYVSLKRILTGLLVASLIGVRPPGVRLLGVPAWRTTCRT